MTYETKADALDGVFEDVTADAVAELKTEVAALGRQVAAMARPGSRAALGGSGAADDGERKAFVAEYLRKGAQGGVALKSLNGATGSDGGYAVPEEIDRKIDAVLREISPIRAIANVVTVGTSNYRKLVATGGFASGWVAETAGRPETDTPDLAEIAPPMGELYANPAASQAMLDDAMFDVEGWLAEEVAADFAKAEGAAYVAGTGVNRPKGFLSYATSAAADDTRSFGTLQYLPTGVSGNFAASNAADSFVDLIHKLRPAYRQGAAFVMNSATLARIRKMKTTTGDYLWRPGLVDGQAATLLGYPVVEAEDMPDIAADSLSVAFGDFKRGYVIAERAGVSVLRDPYSNKPFVHFYATKRVGGAVTDSNAIKLLKFSAS